MSKKIIIVFFLFGFSTSYGQTKPEGVYTGMERMIDWSSGTGKIFIDKENPGYRWFHFSTLTIRNDSVFLKQEPVFLDKKDTVYSASDGGFYDYTGILFTSAGVTEARVELVYCEYCLSEEARPPGLQNKILVFQKTKDPETLLVNKTLYRKKK
jgi:hypothetical protein